jgi:NosR/NirI family nitrous oxide reductase transcriptional regulator
MKKSTTKLRHFLSFATCFLMILAISFQRDGKWLGNELKTEKRYGQEEIAANVSTVMPDGTTVINTSSLAKDIIGYSGNTPLEIHLKDNKIAEVKALSNQETPEFFNKAQALLTKWNGMTVQEASELKVDAVTGATMTSRAIIGNMKRGLQFAQNDNAKESLWEQFDSSPKALIGLFVALMAAILPLVYKNKKYRIIQQILNVSVLGFWCGTFLSYSSIIGFVSNGINVIALMIPTILLITAFIYPFFGKKTYYCAHVCPFGSLQELTGKVVKYKIKISTKTQKRLDTFRQLLWAILMICLWTGLWSEWIDYEPFSAFIFGSASWIVISIAIVFTLLSSVITRPYCRYVCPTGTLMKISQISK